jgi:adenylyl- and sulfurtransferase ThiI
MRSQGSTLKLNIKEMLKWLTKRKGKSVRTQRVVVRRQAMETIAVPVAKVHATSHRSTAIAVIPNAAEISKDQRGEP